MRAGALIPSRKIVTTCARSTRKGFFETLIYVFALIVSTDVTSTAISINFTFYENLSALT